MYSDILIAGAGASGLTTAYLLAKKGLTVTIIEKNSTIGKKIIVSGNGKCNITNKNISSNRFYGNRDFIEEFLKEYNYKKIEEFFKELGVELIEEKEGKVFPLSKESHSIISHFKYALETLKVSLHLNTNLENIEKKDDFFIIQTSKETFKSKYLLLSTGSPSAPHLGGDETGAKIASFLGHTLKPFQPALVQLCSNEKWIKNCAGVRIKSKVTLLNKTSKEGDLLFTNYGISGLVILDLSYEILSQKLSKLNIDILPEHSKENLKKLFLSRKTDSKPLELWLDGIIPKKLIPIILKNANLLNSNEKDLTNKKISSLIYAIKNLTITVTGSKGFKGAEVAYGGISTDEIDPKTMKSKKIENLYFAGEIIDIIGERGGFNLHFAWLSAIRVAKSISK